MQVGASIREVEVICSDLHEHRRRIEARSPDIDGLPNPSWEDVLGREYQAWEGDRTVLDTAGKSPAGSLAELRARLGH